MHTKHFHLPQGLFFILEPSLAQGRVFELVETVAELETGPIMVRRHGLSFQEYQDLILEIDHLKKEMDFDFIVQHDVDLVLKTQAVGVHLTSLSVPVGEARQVLGNHRVIGYSAHSFQEAVQAKQAGADYVFLGAIFPTPKQNTHHPVLGLDVLALTCKRLDCPVYAIGGINSENLLMIRSAGAAGFCALRAVYKGEEITHHISKLNLMWNEL